MLFTAPLRLGGAHHPNVKENFMRKHARTLLGLALAAALVAPAAAQPGGTKVGVLTCRTAASIGLIVGSHQRIACSFAPDAGGGRPDNYAGYITRVGLDLGVTTGGVMTWGVVAPVSGWHHGALAGQYAGASGSVSAGVGVGANALVGGSHRSFALQPLSVSGNVGVNLALGVAGLTLRSVR